MKDMRMVFAHGFRVLVVYPLPAPWTSVEATAWLHPGFCFVDEIHKEG
jgi:hypothetical protein